MQLRTWQKENIEKAVEAYASGKRHFLTLATPGAGKTIFASYLAKIMLDRNMIDLVLCFSPRSIVASDFTEIMSKTLNTDFDGRLGALGFSTTYQNMLNLKDSVWNLLNQYRVLIVFDEIHHCAGTNTDNANAWGEKIILKIQNKAAYTLALSGTPWRSDCAPIVLSNYCNRQSVICDFVYGLQSAIQDGVCRVPQITIIDNDGILVTDKEKSIKFSSLKGLIDASEISYTEILENYQLIKNLLLKANKKLNQLRVSNIDAGGLIVASSVKHAKAIQAILLKDLKESSTIVTYQESNPEKVLKRFRNESGKWLVSVGMVSEGTNIPRLQVCVHLTNISTELHFRQILGRILRTTSSPIQLGFLFMPAHPKLAEYANRVRIDVPDQKNVINYKSFSSTSITQKNNRQNQIVEFSEMSMGSRLYVSEKMSKYLSHSLPSSPLTNAYERMIDISGKFRQEIIQYNNVSGS